MSQTNTNYNLLRQTTPKYHQHEVGNRQGTFYSDIWKCQKGQAQFYPVFKRKRLYGYDSEGGGKYHCHPFNNPDDHLFTNEKKSIQEFVKESMRFLEDEDILQETKIS